MKKILISAFALLALAACQKKQWFASCPEIDLVKKGNAAYFSGDWTTFRGVYADTCKIYDNVWDAKKAVSPDDFTKGVQTTLANFSEYKMGISNYEMVVADNGEKWVHNWFVWQGKHKNGQAIEIPIHITFRVIDDKVVLQANFYNFLPAYLANNPPAPVDTVKRK